MANYPQTAGSVADGSVTTVKLADGAVTAAKVAADVATQAELDAEASARAVADTTLQTNVTAEASSRASADTSEAAARVAGDLTALHFTPTAVKTANYTAAAGDLVPVDTTSGAVTVTLPNAPADHTSIAVKHVIQGGTNAVTVACAGSDVFNKAGGSTSLSLPLLAQGAILVYKSSGGIWYIVADDLALTQLDARYAATTDARLSDTRTPTDGSVTDAKITSGGLSPSKVTGTAVITSDSRLSDARTPTDGSVTAAKVAAALKPSGSAAASDEALRALGTSASTAAAGNDSRLSDTRTPTDNSVTSAKIVDGAIVAADINGALKPSGTAATTDEALRALGTAAGTAAAGNDSRLSDSRAPSGAAGGDLTGTYPNPTIGTAKVTSAQVAFDPARQALPSDSDLLLWNYDPVIPANSTVITKGQQQFLKLRTSKAITVTNVILEVVTGGTSLSNCFVGLLDASGTLLTGSSDQSTSWQSAGLKTCALTTPQAIAADTVFYITFLVGNGSTTSPAFARNASPVAMINGLLTAAHGYRFGTNGSSLTALASVTLSGASAAGVAHWGGAS